MRTRTLPMVGFLAFLGVSSWFATSSLLAQARRRAVPPAMTKGLAGEGATAAPASNSVPVKTTASFTFDEMTVTGAHGRVGVHAKVSIMDSRPGKRYMWSLLVMDEHYTVIATTDYANQVFSTRPGVTLEPTFEEAFQLLPGRYIVELRLYDVSPGMDLSVLNRTSAVLVPEILLSHNEPVTVEQ